MKYADLTHVLKENMPVYPGTEPPLFLPGNTIEKDGFAEKKITMFSHTGTHMDAPAHMVAGAPGLDDFPVDKFTGTACLLDFAASGRRVIEKSDLSAIGKSLGNSDFLLIRTGWDRFWGSDEYFASFPVLNEEAARYLAALPLKGIGIDAISVDPVGSADMGVHKILFGRNFIIIENLKGLDRIPAGDFRFSAFPLKIDRADGSPVRALAEWDLEGGKK